jgi:hypothetical protein
MDVQLGAQSAHGDGLKTAADAAREEQYKRDITMHLLRPSQGRIKDAGLAGLCDHIKGLFEGEKRKPEFQKQLKDCLKDEVLGYAFLHSLVTSKWYAEAEAAIAAEAKAGKPVIKRYESIYGNSTQRNLMLSMIEPNSAGED